MSNQKLSSKNLSFNQALHNPLFQEAFNSYKIKVIAPASGACPEKIENLRQITQLNLDISPTIISEGIIYHASSDEDRFKQLKDALFDSSKNTLIWTLRGGYGSARLIPMLSELPRPEQEKIFIGYSDNTALHLFLSQQWHWKTIHASGLAQISDPKQDPMNYMKIAEIVGKTVSIQSVNNLKPFNVDATRSNRLKGCLTGGNLTIVESSIGTSWQIQTAGKIVFLEETGEKGYRIDRSLNHLCQAGLLQGVTAIIFGECLSEVKDDTINIALERFAQNTSVPVYKTNQFGHGKINYPLVYNTTAVITPSKNSDCSELTMALLK